MEERNEETPVFLDRSSRATRGKRMTKLLDDELEEDEMFWNQEALKEEENDDQYEEEEGGEVADEFDSDFNDDESEPDNDVVNDVEDRTRPKKRLIFPGKAPSKKKKKMKKDLLQINKTQKEEKLSNNSRPPHDLDAPDDTEGEKSVRKSTRTAVIVKQAERDAIRAALQPIAKPIKRKKEGEEKRMSQEEMLLEAAQTEIMNLRNLERVLAREEEVKKRAVVHKAVYTGPQIRYISKAGHNYLEFEDLSFESQLMTESVPYPTKAVCAVTGLPAKYRDPKTGMPYAAKEAFRVIRDRFSNANIGNRKVDMGSLSDSISGQGFGVKRKRSMASSHDEASFHRSDARFRKIPSVDYGVSD